MCVEARNPEGPQVNTRGAGFGRGLRGKAASFKGQQPAHDGDEGKGPPRSPLTGGSKLILAGWPRRQHWPQHFLAALLLWLQYAWLH